MAEISLTRNLNGGVTLDDLRLQFGEFSSRLEDYLNGKVDIHLIQSRDKKEVRPTFKVGDLVLDLTKNPGIATLQQWDGKKLVSIGFEGIVGFIDLIERGIGSGNDPTKFLASDGDGRWRLESPSKIDTADIAATEDIPALSLVTANGKVADSANLSHFNHVVGLSMIAVPNGNIATVVVEGEVTDLSWSWTTNDKLFLNGTTLSTLPPSSGFSQFIALARNSQTIFVRLQIPVKF